jgi:hypothetical protein
MGGPEGAKLIEAVEHLASAIKSNMEMAGRQRDVAPEIAYEVVVAAKSPKPNAAKIVGLLGGLAMTIQTIASLQGAWDKVRAIAAVIGLHI